MKPIRVLIIEDNEDDILFIREFLAEAPTTIDLVSSNELKEGLAKLSEENFDVVLVDLNLPDSKGLDTFVTVNREAPAVPAIVFTGYSALDMGIEAIAKGAQDYLVKGQITSHSLIRSLQCAMERKRIAEALKTSEARFRLLIEKNLDPILLVDKKGIVRLINPAAESLIGKSAGEITGFQFGFPVIDSDKAEINIVKPGGNITAEMRVADIKWENDDLYLVSLRDISERKKMELELRYVKSELIKAIEELKGANRQILEHQKCKIEEERLKVLLQISGTTAHELHQLLTTLLGNIELMKLKKNDPQKIGHYMEMIENSVQDIAAIAKRMRVLPSPQDIFRP